MSVFTDEKVVLELSRETYNGLLLALGMALAASGPNFNFVLRLINTINEGNPYFEPYARLEGGPDLNLTTEQWNYLRFVKDTARAGGKGPAK